VAVQYICTCHSNLSTRFLWKLGMKFVIPLGTTWLY